MFRPSGSSSDDLPVYRIPYCPPFFNIGQMCHEACNSFHERLLDVTAWFFAVADGIDPVLNMEIGHIHLYAVDICGCEPACGIVFLSGGSYCIYASLVWIK